MDAIAVFERTVARVPDRPFLLDGDTTVTYAQAHARVGEVAAALERQGVSDGERLALAAPDSVELVLTILAAWRAGALPAMIDARTGDEDLPYFVTDIDAKLVVAAPHLLGRLRQAGATDVVALGELGEPGAITPPRHGPDAPLYLSYTSGSTGAPKGCLLTSAPVALGTACIADRLRLGHQDVIMATTPAASSFQLVSTILPALHRGAAVCLAPGRDVEAIWSLVHATAATVLVAYPLTLADIVNAPPADSGASLRAALSGGSPLAPRIKRDYAERLGIPLAESYGQSELGGFMAMGRPDDDARAVGRFVGTPLPDRIAYVGGDDGRELPVGDVGEVMVPNGYFAGYRNRPDADVVTLAGGILHCGDLGVMDADGYLRVLGRTREAEVARRRGWFLRDAEDALYEHPDVKHAAAVECREHGDVEAYVELLDGRDPHPGDVADFVAEQLPGSARPRRVTVLTQMPRTFSGKADRMALARRCGA